MVGIGLLDNPTGTCNRTIGLFPGTDIWGGGEGYHRKSIYRANQGCEFHYSKLGCGDPLCTLYRAEEM